MEIARPYTDRRGILSRRAGHGGRSPAHRGDWRLALILILPATAGFIAFAAYPALRGIYLSFTDFRILSPATWSGPANYRQLLSDSDVDALTWTHDGGGTFWKMIKHLAADKNGVRGDQPGFNAARVQTYGVGNLESTGDPFGQNAWGWLLPNDGINIPDSNQWPTVFNYADPKVVNSVQLVRSLTNDGFAPKLNQFTTADTQQLGSGSVAMVVGGTWEASTFASLPNIKVGVAPIPAGSAGKRALMTNSNGNNIWTGTKHVEQTWKWVSYQESEACQTTAAEYNGSFFPSIAASMDALAKKQAGKGTYFSVFSEYVKNGELFPCPVYNNGAALTNAMVPQFESYFTNKADEGIFAKMQEQSKTLLAKQK